MKKLMIAAAIVCAAAFAQAATFNWVTSSALLGPNVDFANLKTGTVGNGSKNAYSMSGVTWTYVMTLSNDSGASDELSGNVSFSMNKVSNKNLSSDVMWKPAEATDPSNFVDYSIVITGTYKDANDVTWTFTSDPIAKTGVEYASSTALQISSAGASGWTVTSSAVPEPTSGLLLLLGVAGLALRRRRA